MLNGQRNCKQIIREPDALEMNMKLFCAKDIEAAFKAGTKWADKYSELKEATNLNRKEEILKAAIDDSRKNMLYGLRSFVAGAEWADGHPIKLEDYR